MQEIYLDNSATTPLAPEVIAEMERVMREVYGNPSSLHSAGLAAEKVLSAARRDIMRSIGLRAPAPSDYKRLIFTGSGTEANNLAILGTACARRASHGVKRFITSADQHPSVLEPMKRLEAEGCEVVRIPVRGGRLDLGALESALCDSVQLVSIMLVNNETGALYDVKTAFSMVHSRCPNAITHCDAVQGYHKLANFSPDATGADMATLSAHKINGPKGVGALYVSPDVLRSHKLSPIILGGGQENGMRSGTENLIGIAGFAAASKLTFDAAAAERSRDYIEKRLPDGVIVNRPPVRAPHILSLTLPHIKSETMLHYLSERGVFVSSGSACASHSRHVSYALTEFGIDPREADCTLRVSLDDKVSDEMLDVFISALASGTASLVRI